MRKFIGVMLLFPALFFGCNTHQPVNLEKFTMEDAAKTVVLGNHRKVGWMECGDPKGFPIFYAHGCPGSRLEALFLDEKARQYGFRVIVFERPGFGRSDFVDGYALLSFADDVEKMADTLHIEKFGLIGWSSGGPPVLATAYHMPDRAVFACCVSSYTDFGKFKDAKDLMVKYNLYGPVISEDRPQLFDRVVEMVRWADDHLPNFYFKLARGEMSDSDREILNDPNVAALFMRDQHAAMIDGTRGILQDLEVQWSPWDFDFQKISVPVFIYQGKADTFVPWQFAQHLADNIPNAKLTLYPDQGHLFFLNPDFQDVMFRQIRKRMRRSSGSKL